MSVNLLGTLKLFMISASGGCFSNRTSVTYLLMVSMVEFDGARNKVWGLASMLTRTLSFVMKSFDSDTREFRFNCLICADVGSPVLNDAKKIDRRDIEIYGRCNTNNKFECNYWNCQKYWWIMTVSVYYMKVVKTCFENRNLLE